MNTSHCFALFLAGLTLLSTQVVAQSVSNRYSFTAYEDGAYPSAGLITSGNKLYSTTKNGGTNGQGAVFSINLDGSGFTNLHSFILSSGSLSQAGLILEGDTLYGTTYAGGSRGAGTVFALKNDGSSYRVLHDFIFTDGAQPKAALILLGDTLFGTTHSGGSSGSDGGPDGALFALNTNGTGFRLVHSFTEKTGAFPGPSTNSGGSNPQAALIAVGDTLYGTTLNGGDGGFGTVFAVKADGTSFAALHSFEAGNRDLTGNYTNIGGINPNCQLAFAASRLLGTAYSGGNFGNGSIFSLNTNGTGFATVHGFTGGADGAKPFAGLTRVGDSLYGTTVLGGGPNNAGTIFRLNLDGTGFTTLHAFSGGLDGSKPFAELTPAGNALFGAASLGGDGNWGALFSLQLSAGAPRLAISKSGSSIVLTWPTNATGYVLQTTTNLAPAAKWNAVTLQPVVINDQRAVTNPISGPSQFFRLN